MKSVPGLTIVVAELKKLEPEHSWKELVALFGVSQPTLRRIMECKDKVYTVDAGRAKRTKAAAKRNKAAAKAKKPAAKAQTQIEAQAAVLKDYMTNDLGGFAKPVAGKKYIRQEIDLETYNLWQSATKDLDKEDKRELFESALSAAIYDLQYPDRADEKASCLAIGVERKFDLLESIKA